MISAIVYTSTSGSCEYYAREMSRKLAIPCYEAKKCGLPKGMEIVFIGWLMNGKVTGLDAAMKDYNVKGVVQVGMGARQERSDRRGEGHAADGEERQGRARHLGRHRRGD